jgi:hypothetical protein
MKRTEDRHRLVDVGGVYSCERCRWTFQKHSNSDCPGVPRYGYDSIPDFLLTLPQLKCRNLKPDGPPDACYRRLQAPYWVWYYDARKAVPSRSVWQRLRPWSILKDALAARFICTWCGYEATSEEERRLISSQRLCEPCLFERRWIRRRKEIPGWAQGMVQSQNAAILDIEAFGHGRSAEILDLALITPDGQRLFNSPFRPKYPLPLPFEAEDTAWLMNEKDIPTLPAIWPQLIALLGRFPTVLCYNADFHHAMLVRSARQDQLLVPAAEWHCLMKIYAQFHGKLRRDGEFLWYKLNDACKEEKVNAGHSYRALPRAQRAARLLRALAAKTELEPGPPQPKRDGSMR